MKRLTAAVCLSVLFLAGCKKREGENQNLDPSKQQTFDIMSGKKGSWWLYTASDNSVFYRYATGRDSVVDGLNYAYYYRVDTTSRLREEIPEFFGKNDGKYISLIDLYGNQKTFINYVILKDNPYLNQHWDNTQRKMMGGFNVDMLIESQVVGLNETMTVGGKSYDSIIHVYNNLKAKLIVVPDYSDCGYLEVWFRKGTGIIKERGHMRIELNNSLLYEKDYADELLDYHIEP